MRICEVIGRITLSRGHESIRGGRWLLSAPLNAANLESKTGTKGEPIVVYDEWGAGLGNLIAVSEGAEAAAPFDGQKPLDAYNSAILDSIEIASSNT